MKKILFGFLAVTMLTLVGCHKDNNEKEDPIAERTVLIYMAAQNNLTYWSTSGYRYADEDLLEMKEAIANLGDNHLVVYVDKAKYAAARYDDYKPYLLHYRKGELRDSIPMDSTAIPCDPATMRTVIKKAFSEFPAKDYGLVLWGHATGWLIRTDTIASSAARKRAYGGTMYNGTNQGSGNVWMNIPTLAKVLKEVPHLKFIFADCCNMMCAENAYELKDVCDYFIGSPAEIPGPGAPYDIVVPAMMEKETFYQSICDYYADYYDEEVPMAAVKSSEMASLAAQTKTTLQTMDLPEYFTSTELKNQRLIYYLDHNLYDINHFFMTYATEAEYNSWKQAYDKAVVYKRMATRWDTMNLVNFRDFDVTEENFGGMSMFIPQEGLQRTDNQTIKKMGWYYAAGYNTIKW